jgi:ABC-type spermidine/putrescine transport system permease subunit II
VKIARTVILIFFLIVSLAIPILFLAIRHFHLEDQAAEWMVSMWPRSFWTVALEDRRAAADMLITYGELAGASMLAYTAIGWCGVFVYRRFFRRVRKAKDPGSLDSGSLRSG